MFSKAIAPHWRPRDTGPLRVREGQITFDAEGVDYLTAVEPFRQPEARTMKSFSRILYWPGKNSGVTLGRGYDMKLRSSGQILTELRQAGIEEYKAVICSKASGLNGQRDTTSFIKAYGPLVGEITHLQQVNLFYISYKVKKDYAKGLYFRQSRDIKNPLSWERINPIIKDVFIDIIYMGTRTAKELVKVIATGGDKQDVYNFISSDSDEKNDLRRMNIRLEYLK